MCGVSFIRYKKKFEHYVDKYETPYWGVNKLSILMQKQTNRGQDGAGVVVLKTNQEPGKRYISEYKSIEKDAISDIFSKINKKSKKYLKDRDIKTIDFLKENIPFTGEVFMGHVRYTTHGYNSIENCHPFLRKNNWRSRNLLLMGNFNMTNADELFQRLIEVGQFPKDTGDTITALEKIGHYLDEENQLQFLKYKHDYNGLDLSMKIEGDIKLQRVLRNACKDFDGGYSLIGSTGYGGNFLVRDPHGIRPLYYWENDEVFVAASERPAIKAAFGSDFKEIKEVKPGHAIIISKMGTIMGEHEIVEPQAPKHCSFERIYFSRSYDSEIYQERKKMGQLIVPQILEHIDYDFENTVFSYVPNTSETSFIGMIEALSKEVTRYKLSKFKKGKINEDIINLNPRIEKLIVKDEKLRTFITNGDRNKMVANAYDTTPFIINEGKDNLVVIDDSVVRGTTLKRNVLTTLNRLKPKKIVFVSTSPIIKYPDCYGIDMSILNDLIAFKALISLLKRDSKQELLNICYDKCKTEGLSFDVKHTNFVKELYELYSDDELIEEISKLVKPDELDCEFEMLYLPVDKLHEAIGDGYGDWYFTGNYPTNGGNRTVKKAFINFMEGNKERAY